MSKREIFTCDICDKDQSNGFNESPYAIALIWTGMMYHYHICRECHRKDKPKKILKVLWVKFF